MQRRKAKDNVESAGNSRDRAANGTLRLAARARAFPASFRRSRIGPFVSVSRVQRFASGTAAHVGRGLSGFAEPTTTVPLEGAWQLEATTIRSFRAAACAARPFR